MPSSVIFWSQSGVFLAKNMGTDCFHHLTKVRENTLTPLFSLSKSQRAINLSITFSVSNLYVAFFFFLRPSFHLSHSFSFSDTPSFICTAAVRPDHLRATYSPAFRL